jgi:ABC-2 type transport system ATP-binding protein
MSTYSTPGGTHRQPAPDPSYRLIQPSIRSVGLTKSYPVYEQAPGLAGAVRGLLRRRTQQRVAVSDLDLEVPQGQILGLLGPNGAGKTTTIKMMCGLLRPTSGDLQVLGREPGKRSFEFLRSISVIFGQKSMLWWDVSCFDSLLVHRQMYDLSRVDFHSSVAELTELLAVGDFLNIPVRRLSLGQRMRCELMLALLHRPRLLFADEPTVGLDVVAKANVRSFLARVNRQLGMTMILTSHDMDDVEALCRRVVVIDHGAKRFDGDLPTLTMSVRPAKQVRVVYAAPLAPLPLARPLPRGARILASSEAQVLEMEVDREKLTQALTEVTSWGRVVDLQVGDADLDQVMAEVFGRAGEEVSGRDGGGR